MKRAGSFAVALGAAVVLAATSLQAVAATPKPQIEDPVGDANGVNDQGTGDGSFGDQTAADAGTVSDLISITFSNNAKDLVIMFETEAAPPAATGVGYRVRVNPDGTGGTYCLRFEVYFPGANNALTAAEAFLFDDCAGGDPVPIKVLGTQLTIPRKANKAFAKGGKLTAPQAQTFFYSGSNYPNGATVGTVDTTKVGTDFVFKK
jgi:hypothetical protein